ncbi:hypothetical protein [Celeribacter baekdonensis]|uniref:hypothetical protein n=1 Tax=Celeribacter baekdonensis TaxID=875171 RepID=UPI0019000CE1|nr:hypothetical protein [Celeribacter baekdonensis]
MAQEAERLLTGSGWMPEPLRGADGGGDALEADDEQVDEIEQTRPEATILTAAE